MSRICDVCGKEFEPNVHNQKRCSQECSAEAIRRQGLKYYYSHQEERKAKQHEYYLSHREERLRYTRNYYRKRKKGKKRRMKCGRTIEECLNCRRPECKHEPDM